MLTPIFLHKHYTEQSMNINVDGVLELAMSVRMGGSLHRRYTELRTKVGAGDGSGIRIKFLAPNRNFSETLAT